jgi:hypothetical protein
MGPVPGYPLVQGGLGFGSFPLARDFEYLFLPFLVVRISPSQMDKGRFLANGELDRTVLSEASSVNCEQLGYIHPLLKLSPPKDEGSK